MANEVLASLDTSSVADGFEDFLSSQGLGDMNPTSAARYRKGVEISPMDEILALNGKNLDDLFRRKLPEPPPLSSLTDPDNSQNADNQVGNGSDLKSAVKSLGLSEAALNTLNSLLSSGGAGSVGELPASLQQLLQNSGVNNALDLIKQLAEMQALIGNTPIAGGKDISQLMVELMAALNIFDSTILLNYIRNEPLGLREFIRDPLTGIAGPLGSTTSLLKSKSPFEKDPIIGSTADETLLARLAGGTRLTGGGGSDIYVLQLSDDPFPLPSIITDYDAATGDKIALYTGDYQPKLNSKFRIANNQSRFKKLGKKNISLLYSSHTNELLINGNLKGNGLGKGVGGPIAIFENDSDIAQQDLLIIRENALYSLSGIPYAF